MSKFRKSALQQKRVAERARGDGAAKTVVLTVDLKTLSGFSLSVLRPSNWHLVECGNIQKD
jgi:hypothetical protein